MEWENTRSIKKKSQIEIQNNNEYDIISNALNKNESIEQIAKNLKKLDDKFDNLSSKNTEIISKLWNWLSNLEIKLMYIIWKWGLSEKSSQLWKKLLDEIKYLSSLLENRQDFNMNDYWWLSYDLEESLIDNTMEKIEKIWEATYISIWIDKYRDMGIENLEWSVNDANAITNKLKSHYNISEVNRFTNETATKENILNFIKNAPKDKPIFLYYAWHWIDWHMITYNSDIVNEDEIKNNSISPKELYDAIWDRKAIVIVDKCYWWNLVNDAPENITVVSSTDDKTAAFELEWSSRSIHRKYITIDWYHNIRWVFTNALTNTPGGFDLRRAVKTANSQNPQIK